MPAKNDPVKDNTVERAYNHLREETVNFGFRPGGRINEVELATTLGMSRAPVREALNRLIADGLVVFEARRGFFCRKLSASETVDLFAVRADLELSAVRRACAVAAPQAIADLREKWGLLDSARTTMTVDELVAADESFHLELVALAGNPERVRYLANINARIRFVRRINLEDELRHHSSLEEHLPILNALASRDSAKAADLMEQHLTLSIEQAKAHIATGLSRIFADDVA